MSDDFQDFFESPETRLVFGVSALVRSGRHLVDFDLHYRFIVRDHALAGRQFDQDTYNMLRKLRQLTTNGYIVSLVSMWDQNKIREQSKSIPDFLIKAGNVVQSSQKISGLPLPDGNEDFAKITRKLKRCSKKTRASKQLARLQNFRHKEIAHRLTQTQAEVKSGPIDEPIHNDIDYLFVRTIWCVNEIARVFFGEQYADFREYMKARDKVSKRMWYNVNRSLARRTGQKPRSPRT